MLAIPLFQAVEVDEIAAAAKDFQMAIHLRTRLNLSAALRSCVTHLLTSVCRLGHILSMVGPRERRCPYARRSVLRQRIVGQKHGRVGPEYGTVHMVSLSLHFFTTMGRCPAHKHQRDHSERSCSVSKNFTGTLSFPMAACLARSSREDRILVTERKLLIWPYIRARQRVLPPASMEAAGCGTQTAASSTR